MSPLLCSDVQPLPSFITFFCLFPLNAFVPNSSCWMLRIDERRLFTPRILASTWDDVSSHLPSRGQCVALRSRVARRKLVKFQMGKMADLGGSPEAKPSLRLCGGMGQGTDSCSSLLSVIESWVDMSKTCSRLLRIHLSFSSSCYRTRSEESYYSLMPATEYCLTWWGE